jgi:DNA-directed RNA polymerase specialized sigma24 family protein
MKPDDRASQRPEEGVGGLGNSPVPDAVSTVAMDSKFREFGLREYRGVIRFLMRCGASLQSADTAVQQAFFEAWQLAKKGAWAGVPNKGAWIRTVAHDKYLELPDSPLAQVTPVSYLSEGAQPRYSTSDLTAETRHVLRAFQVLPAEQRVVMAFKMDQIPEHVIAVHMSITDQEVRELYEAARRALARSLAGMTTPPEEANP